MTVSAAWGVLCDVFDPSGWNSYGDYYQFPDGENNGSCLSGSFRQDLDITPVQESILISMNDEGKSFGEIADYIERNL